jgi:hypothetical protein
VLCHGNEKLDWCLKIMGPSRQRKCHFPSLKADLVTGFSMYAVKMALGRPSVARVPYYDELRSSTRGSPESQLSVIPRECSLARLQGSVVLGCAAGLI